METSAVVVFPEETGAEINTFLPDLMLEKKVLAVVVRDSIGMVFNASTTSGFNFLNDIS